MPNSSTTSTTSRFLGVRLTLEEARRLDELRATRGLASRSDAVRALLREGPREATGAVDLPVTRRRELESLVEEGYFTTVQAALEHALEAGLAELVRTHTEGFSALRRHAREARGERDGRRRADREGRGLLGR